MVTKRIENSLVNNTTNLIDGRDPVRIKHYDESAVSAKAVNAFADAAGVPPAEGAVETEAPERIERRAAFKRAADIEARAQRMEKEAKEKLSRAEGFEKLKETASTDPVALAKALGMDPTEFLRRYQNQMLSIPNEVPLKPEEEVKARLARYETERQKEKEEHEVLKAQTFRANYTAMKILPVITMDPVKFEILNENGAEASSQYIYDMIDKHYRETGEEWKATDVAEELENLLAQEVEEKIEKVKKSPRFAKHFSQPQVEPVAVSNRGQSLAETKSKTLSDSKFGSIAASSPSSSGNKVPLSNRRARIDKVLKKFQGQ